MSTNRYVILTIGVTMVLAFMAWGTQQVFAQAGVRIVPKESEQKIDVLMDGELFTSYILDSKYEVLKKPALYPLKSPSGVEITRGYPLESKPGERVDHPHHIGLWFNYGDVNGLDFWNNSSAIPEDRQDEMGHIVHWGVNEVKNGEQSGELVVTSGWLSPDNQVLLREETRFVFHKRPAARVVDRISTLTATGQRVRMHDNKEGMLGLRVTRALEYPSERPLRLTGPDGEPMEEPVLDNEGVNGEYTSSEGITGVEVWGTRAKWMKLSGVVEGQPVTVAILDHPDNVGYPTFWHARAYGLFAANPLGQAVFTEGDMQLNYELPAGESVTFKYRILIIPGRDTADQVEQEYQKWVRETT